jgi:hypothetical protein
VAFGHRFFGGNCFLKIFTKVFLYLCIYTYETTLLVDKERSGVDLEKEESLDIMDLSMKQKEAPTRLQIIDFARKGNVVRFFLGSPSLRDYGGDDWDDAPYDCNAGPVYENFVLGYKDVAFPFDDLVKEPSDDLELCCRFSKDDMKKKSVPCLVVLKKKDIGVGERPWELDDFAALLAHPHSKRFYFGDLLIPDVLK